VKHHSRPFFLFLVLACSQLVFALDPPPAYVKHCASCHVAMAQVGVLLQLEKYQTCGLRKSPASRMSNFSMPLHAETPTKPTRIHFSIWASGSQN
jgi:hypothetical protein